MTKWFELAVSWLGIQVLWELQLWWGQQTQILSRITTLVPLALTLEA